MAGKENFFAPKAIKPHSKMWGKHSVTSSEEQLQDEVIGTEIFSSYQIISYYLNLCYHILFNLN